MFLDTMNGDTMYNLRRSSRINSNKNNINVNVNSSNENENELSIGIRRSQRLIASKWSGMNSTNSIDNINKKMFGFVNDNASQSIDCSNSIDSNIENNSSNNNNRAMTRSMKRKYKSLNENENENENITKIEYYDREKKRQRTIKFILENKNSNNYDKIGDYFSETYLKTLDEYRVLPISNNNNNNQLRSSNRRNGFVCMYTFGNGWTITIDHPIGRYGTGEVKECLNILKQNLTNARAKATLETNKNAYLIWIRNPKNKMVASGIFHEHALCKRVNIEMFATDIKHRNMGLADIMIYLLQYLMHKLPKHDLFVCAALDAVPFWMNKKYNFVKCDARLLQEHELSDEKTGNVTHLIWHSYDILKTQELNLINSFVKFEKLKHKRKDYPLTF